MKTNPLIPRLILACLALFILPVISQAQPNSTLMQNAVVANGNGTELNTDQRTTAAIVVNCVSCSGGTTFNFEGTIDGTNYASVTATKLPGTTTGTSATTSGVTNWIIPVAGLLNVRVRISAYSAGTITVRGTTTNTSSASGSGGGGGGGGASTIADGADAAEGTTTDTKCTATDTTACTVVGLLKQNNALLGGTLTVSGGGGGTQYTQDAALTVATTVMTMAGGRASAAVPTDVSADNDAVLPWYLRSGALANQPTFGGILAVAGNGASGTGVQRITLANDSTGILAGVTTVATVTNLSQMGGVPIALGNGTSATGVQRVTLSSDSTGQVALAAGAALVGDVNLRFAGTAAAVNVGASTAQTLRVAVATDSGGLIAQNSTTSGQVGNLDQMAVLTNPPTYTTATSNPLTGDIHGALRVVCQYSDGTVCTQNDVVSVTGGGAADATAFTAATTSFNPIGGVYSTANLATSSGNEYAARITQTRGLHTNLRNENGLELGTPDNPISIRAVATSSAASVGLVDPSVPASNLMSIIGPLGNSAGVDGDRLRVNQYLGDDPCGYRRKTDVAISQTASTTVITGLPGMMVHICLLRVVAGVAEITSEWEGTGSACGTGTIAHSGSLTAANGESFAANGGYSTGDGNSSVITLGPGTNFCLAQSGSSRVSGKVSYVYASPVTIQ